MAKSTSGYTLIELASVVMILSMLSSTAVSAFNGVAGTAEMSVVYMARANIQTGMYVYFGETGLFPKTFKEFVQTENNTPDTVGVDLSTLGAGDCEIKNENMISCPKAFKTISIAMYAFDDCGVKIRLVNTPGGGGNGNQQGGGGNQFEGCEPD